MRESASQIPLQNCYAILHSFGVSNSSTLYHPKTIALIDELAGPAPKRRGQPLHRLFTAVQTDKEILPPFMIQTAARLLLLEGTDGTIKEILHVVLRLVAQDAPGL